MFAEGSIDHCLLAALLERIAQQRANYNWPVSAEDGADLFPIRKRGHGGVRDALHRIVKMLGTPPLADYAVFVAVVDGRSPGALRELRDLVSRAGSERFVLGVAICEIEAWWLADRTATLRWLGFGSGSPQGLRYARAGYMAEKDDAPKRTLGELTRRSDRLDRAYGDGNLELAREFAQSWRSCARLGDLESQCPKGFKPFCKGAAAALRRAKARAGVLF